MTLPAALVTTAKIGEVQVPVKRGFPPKDSVEVFPVTSVAGSETTVPVMMDTSELVEVTTTLISDAVKTATVDVDPPSPRTTVLESPTGEQPTKSGAVSFTEAQFC